VTNVMRTPHVSNQETHAHVETDMSGTGFSVDRHEDVNRNVPQGPTAEMANVHVANLGTTTTSHHTNVKMSTNVILAKITVM
jgi:hypothetical protein